MLYEGYTISIWRFVQQISMNKLMSKKILRATNVPASLCDYPIKNRHLLFSLFNGHCWKEEKKRNWKEVDLRSKTQLIHWKNQTQVSFSFSFHPNWNLISEKRNPNNLLDHRPPNGWSTPSMEKRVTKSVCFSILLGYKRRRHGCGWSQQRDKNLISFFLSELTWTKKKWTCPLLIG